MKGSARGSGRGHHKNRKPPASRGAPPPERWHFGVCPECGKHRYATRRAARAAWKNLHRYSPMSVYQCGHYWHYGRNYRKNV